MSNPPDIEFPMLTYWAVIEAEMREGPGISALPIDELVRITRAQFFVGAALVLEGLRGVLKALPEDASMTNHMGVTAFYLNSCSEAIAERDEITLAQTVAVMKAHEVKE